MVGTKLLGQLGNFGNKGGPSGAGAGSSSGLGGLSGAFAGFGKDGSGTERSNYLSKESGVDKSFASSSGYMGLGSHGAVGGIGSNL